MQPCFGQLAPHSPLHFQKRAVMKLTLLVKRVLVFSLSYYLICRFKLFSISLSLFNKNTLFILINFVLLPMLIIHYFCNTFVPVTNDDLRKELQEEFAPIQSNAINFPGAVSIHNSLGNDESVEEKYIILVEKYANQEEETRLDIVLDNQEFVHYGSELVVMGDLYPDQEKQIVCVDIEFDKMESDALNRKFDEFISTQKTKWRSDAAEQQLQLAKI